MKTAYEILNIETTASNEEVRKAYRELSLKYHPDVNHDPDAAEIFRKITESYNILSNWEKRLAYDAAHGIGQGPRNDNFSKKMHEKYAQQQYEKNAEYNQSSENQNDLNQDQAQRDTRDETQEAQDTSDPKNSSTTAKSPNQNLDFLVKIGSALINTKDLIFGFLKSSKSSPRTSTKNKIKKISIIETSISIEEAIWGGKKQIEIPENHGMRSVSIMIPPATRDGGVIRLRNKHEAGEDLVIVCKILPHPFLNIKAKGLVAEIPISVQEAITGCKIKVPCVDGEDEISIPPGSQSGDEIRIKEKGMLDKSGKRGDYFIRLIVKVPQAFNAFGISDKAKDFEMYYEGPVRANLPSKITKA